MLVLSAAGGRGGGVDLKAEVWDSREHCCFWRWSQYLSDDLWVCDIGL